jgi:SAM-dependent methyltransferase
MTDNSIGKTAAGSAPQFLVDLAKNAPAMMWSFTSTIFLSALLLFAIQPMFAKMALPVLGGSPSVWSVSVFFFQGALLGGYLYAHLLINKVPAHLTGIIHLGVCALALICLPISIAAWVGEPPQGEPYLWQLGMFAASIGLPFMAVSANAPLLQAWFARSGHPDARDPYFLYAASNLGSLIALLSYPTVLEPMFGVSQLSHLWAYAYVLLVLAIGGSFVLMRIAQAGGVPETAAAPASAAETVGAAPTLAKRLSWIGLAFVPAALMTAFTVQTTTDVASAPLLWVVPLALYLLTFVLVFRDRPLISREALLFLHLIALAVVLFSLSQARNNSWFVTSATGLAVFFTTAMLAHRTLYEARPAPAYLTEFYLWMSLGGALGGMFTALVAPKLFSQVYEYPLLLALSMACRPGSLSLPKDKEKLKDELIVLWFIAAAGLWAIVALPDFAYSWLNVSPAWGRATIVIVPLAIVMLLNVRQAPRQVLAAMLMCLALVWLPSNVRQGDAQRSFFGVYRVQNAEDPLGTFHVLMHGTTLHGSQRVLDEDGNPVDDTVPTTYYYPGSPIAKSIAKRREILAAAGQKGRYGIVGLGTGSSACHKREGETWKFFEIDPTVINIAKDPKNFTFISKCQPNIDIAVGDARLTIAKEPDSSFDLFIIDAFSSDAIPVHMLTKEAVQLFLNKLKPDGVVLLHTSNRYLDLNSVLGAIQKVLPEGTAAIAVTDHDTRRDTNYGRSISSNVIFAKSEAALQPYRSLSGVSDLEDGGLSAWTDDHSDIWGPFMNVLGGRG